MFDSVSQNYGLQDGFTACGARLFTDLTNQPWFTLDAATGVFTLSSSDTGLLTT